MKKLAVAAMAMLALSACTSTYVGVPYTAGPQPLRDVALADDALPEEVDAYEVASVGSNFGLIGALIDAGVQSSRKNAVNEALATIDYSPEEPLEAYIAEVMAGKGINVTLVEGENREDREFLVDYPEAPEGTQAYFDMVVTYYGYATAGSQTWRPTVLADVRLVDIATGDVMMENRIAYNPINVQAGVITVSPSGEYGFEDREAMVGDPERLAAGIDDALRQVVDTAANLIN
jgi:hypothetical protein